MLHIYLFDTVSGSVIQKIQHDNIVPIGSLSAPLKEQFPVHMVIRENWFVYSFWSLQPYDGKSGRENMNQQLNIVELYQTQPPHSRFV